MAANMALLPKPLPNATRVTDRFICKASLRSQEIRIKYRPAIDQKTAIEKAKLSYERFEPKL
jgi:hypothetical protein